MEPLWPSTRLLSPLRLNPGSAVGSELVRRQCYNDQQPVRPLLLDKRHSRLYFTAQYQDLSSSRLVCRQPSPTSVSISLNNRNSSECPPANIIIYRDCTVLGMGHGHLHKLAPCSANGIGPLPLESIILDSANGIGPSPQESILLDSATEPNSRK